MAPGMTLDEASEPSVAALCPRSQTAATGAP